MAITTFPLVKIPGAWVGAAASAPTLTGLNALNASGDKFAFIFQIPKDGTLHSFDFRTATVGNTPDNGMRLSFQDVSTTTGLPDGVQDQYCDVTSGLTSSTWITPPHALTGDGSSGGVKRTVTQGQMIACVVEFVSFVASDSIALTGLSQSSSATGNLLAYCGDGSTGTFALLADPPVIALKYDDGLYTPLPYPILPILTINNRSFASNSTPDERALRFQVPIGCRVAGATLIMDLDGDADIVLYDNSSGVLASVSLDSNVRTLTTPGIMDCFFTTSVTLTASTTYRLAVKPTTTTSLTLYDFDVSTAALMAGCWGGSQWYGSTRTDAGAWSDTTTARPWVGLMFDGFDTGTGGGGGGAAVMGGTVVR